MRKPQGETQGVWIQAVIEDFVSHSPENHLQDSGRERAFDAPLVGFANGADPLFEAYKDHVGPFHWTPRELFRLVFQRIEVDARELTVISWILPHTRATKADNRRSSRFPAERWARARTFGEVVNAKLRRHVELALGGQGIEAVAPMLLPQWERRTSERYGYASTWSERHAAYACGLGTFGLSDGLITPLGKAMRVGSVVARLEINSTQRPYRDHHAYCLYYTQGICGRCMDRCPAGAIRPEGHDKVACKAYIRQTAMPHIQRAYGFDGRGCGLCQTKVPCESKIPLKKDLPAG
ncbi:MAG: epoxyqueuosine reductase [Desulfobacterales bacterium]